MKLGEKQELFARLLVRLLGKAHDLGYDTRLKELKRGEQQAEWNATHCKIHLSDRSRCELRKEQHEAMSHRFEPIGIRESVHLDGIALDLVLAKDGKVLWADKYYQPLGEFWEGLDPLCRWGGRFRDGGHFSLVHEGRR